MSPPPCTCVGGEASHRSLSTSLALNRIRFKQTLPAACGVRIPIVVMYISKANSRGGCLFPNRSLCEKHIMGNHTSGCICGTTFALIHRILLISTIAPLVRQPQAVRLFPPNTIVYYATEQKHETGDEGHHHVQASTKSQDGISVQRRSPHCKRSMRLQRPQQQYCSVFIFFLFEIRNNAFVNNKEIV